jgi:hypothetical protein
MLLNLLSVYLLAAGLGFLFFDRLKYQLMTTLFLGPALLNEHYQSLLVILAKPDHFLALMVFISFLVTAKMLQAKLETSTMKWTAFFWGVTLSTKLTALPFIPVILLMLFLSDREHWLEKTKDLPKAQVFTSLKPEYSCAIGVIGFEGWKPQEIDSYLYDKHKVHVVSMVVEKVNGIRITPNVYTSTKDLDVLIKGLTNFSKQTPPVPQKK